MFCIKARIDLGIQYMLSPPDLDFAFAEFDVPVLPDQSFRAWWAERDGGDESRPTDREAT